MDFQNDLIKSVGALRRGQGLTPGALADQPLLLRYLDTDDRYEGVERLTALVSRLGDTQDALALRAALAVGVDRLKNTTARRRAAIEDGVFFGTERSIFNAEDRAIKELVELLLDDTAKRSKKSDPFLAAASQPLEDDAPDEPASEHDPDASTEQPQHRRRRLVLIAAMATLALVVGGLVAHSLSDASSQGSKAPEGVSLPEVELDNTSGWGPERKMFSVTSPAPYAAFNSLKDQYTFGDEREFLSCRDKDEKEWHKRIAAEDDHIYICQAWFSNAVSPAWDEGNPAAQLQNARFHVGVPKHQPAYNAGLTGFLTADNTQTVWASCNFLAEKPMTIYYMPRSTFLITKATQKVHGKKGLPMPDKYKGEAIVEGVTEQQGALLGADKQDGIVRQSNGWVQFAVRIDLE